MTRLVIGLGLVALNALAVLLAIRFLRRPARGPLQPALGVLLPIVSASVYLVVLEPPFHEEALLLYAVGVVIGTVLERLDAGPAANGARPLGPRDLAFGAWLLGVVAGLLPPVTSPTESGSQGFAAFAIGMGASIGAGASLRPLLRALSAAPVAAPAMAAAGPSARPPVQAASPPIVAAPPVGAAPPIVAAPSTAVAAPSTAAPHPTAAPPLPIVSAAPTASPALPAAVPGIAPTPDRVHFTHTGRRFVTGYDRQAFAIWDRAQPATPIVRFPRTPEGRDAAWVQYTAWEPEYQATVVTDPAALAVIADGDPTLRFTHVGQRFAIAHSAHGSTIWDRWAPGAPVQRYPVGDAAAQEAWRVFVAWEPAAQAVAAAG